MVTHKQSITHTLFQFHDVQCNGELWAEDFWSPAFCSIRWERDMTHCIYITDALQVLPISWGVFI